MDRLGGKTALITGSGSGIGRATAVLFAKEGASVAVNDVDSKGGKETVRIIRSHGGEASFFRADVTRSEQVGRMVSSIVERYRRIDILHSHVGGVVGPVDTVVDDSEEAWDRLMDLNIKSHFLVTKEVIPHMMRSGGAAIIITITTNAFVNVGSFEAYGTTKAALVQLTKSLSLDYAKHGIRVNALAPGEIFTPLWEKLFNALPNPKRAKKSILRKIPLGRLGRPEDVAACSLFLASDDSRYVTGHVLFVDGGLTAGFYDFTP